MNGAYKILEQSIDRQATVLAFRDCYLLVFCVFVLLIPLVPLLRRPGMPTAITADASTTDALLEAAQESG